MPVDYILISLDATSLFKNIPTDLVKEGIDRRHNVFTQSSKIPTEDWHEVVQFLCNNTFFIFNGQFFYQKFGNPKGSPVSS